MMELSNVFKFADKQLRTEGTSDRTQFCGKIIANFLGYENIDWHLISNHMYDEYRMSSIITPDNRILFTLKHKRGEIPEIANIMDGCIFDMNTNKLISKMGNYNRCNEIPKISSESICEEISDGTTLGLYCFNDKWILRSKNGYDVENMSFYGNMKYGDMFAESTEMLDYEKLDKSKCYSFVVKYIESHLFDDGMNGSSSKITHTETIDINTGELVNDDIGLPKPKQYKFTTPENLANELANSIRQYRSDGTVFYGVVIRCNGKNTILYSELYSLISKALYTNKFNRELKFSGIRRNEFMALVAYLNPKDRANFIGLFPNHKYLFQYMDKEFDEMINIIYDRILSRKLGIKDKYLNICTNFCKMYVPIKDKKLLRQLLINYKNLVSLAKLLHSPINNASSILAI